MSIWKSWGIAGSKTTPELHEEIVAIPGVVYDEKRGIPIFNGSLGDFQQHFKKPFIVYSEGCYIKVGSDV